MLDGIETGYEGKFDFPPIDRPPRITYMLATVPRTGSTWLSHRLWRTGCLGAPLEYLNFDKDGPYGFASRSPELQLQLWRGLLRRRTSPNGVFGIKCFPMQLQALHESNPAMLSEVLAELLPPQQPRRVIHLVRRDRIAHAVSYARATMSGVWRKEQEASAGEPPAYSREAIETAARLLDLQESAWDAMFRDLGISPLRLNYEDAAEQPEETCSRVARFLGVDADPAATVAIPEIARQSGSTRDDWAARYARDTGVDPSG